MTHIHNLIHVYNHTIQVQYYSGVVVKNSKKNLKDPRENEFA